MTNFEALRKGLQLVASNHNLKANVDDWENDGELCIFGGCNIPTISDTRMLCNDVMFPIDAIESSDFGIDIYLDEDWVNGIGAEEYKPSLEYSFWKRTNQGIY